MKKYPLFALEPYLYRAIDRDGGSVAKFLNRKKLVCLRMDFMQSLIIVVIHYTLKKRSLVVANFVFVYIGVL
ncbi:hypothetical protein BK708_37575 [Bacillus thuringiensis serovar yunnanensis]|nr:hypothetical protein BK708_37575 [Bacillus thuringiensis serovar yunnanensis]